jgi:hypothetical protein
MTKTRFPEPQYAKPISDAVLGLARVMSKQGTLKKSAVSHFSINAPLEVEIDYEKGSEHAWKGYGKFRDEMEALGFRSSRCQRIAADGTDRATLTFTIPDEFQSVEKIKALTAYKLRSRVAELIREPLSQARELIESTMPGKAGVAMKEQIMAQAATDLGIQAQYAARGAK